MGVAIDWPFSFELGRLGRKSPLFIDTNAEIKFLHLEENQFECPAEATFTGDLSVCTVGRGTWGLRLENDRCSNTLGCHLSFPFSHSLAITCREGGRWTKRPPQTLAYSA